MRPSEPYSLNANPTRQTAGLHKPTAIDQISVMKITKVAMLILAIAVALYILFPNLSWAEEEVLVRCSTEASVPMIRQEREQAMISYKRQYQLRRAHKNPEGDTYVHAHYKSFEAAHSPRVYRGTRIGSVSRPRPRRLPKPLPATISGTVVDPTDNTIPGATVVLQGPGSRRSLYHFGERQWLL